MSNPEQQPHQFTRDAAQITLDHIKNFSSLNALTQFEADQIFSSLTREIWPKIGLVVHGCFDKDKNGNRILQNRADLDGQGALGLLGLAGINTENVTFVKPGECILGQIHFDTGNQNGVVILYDTKTRRNTYFFDHHGFESDDNNSATALVYETLVGLGLLEQTEALDRLVQFISLADNWNLPKDLESFCNSWQTMAGYLEFMSFDYLYAYFSDPQNPESTQSLGQTIEEVVAQLSLYGVNKRKVRNYKNRIERSFLQLRQIDENGFIFQSNQYGWIVVDLDGKVPLSADAAVAYTSSLPNFQSMIYIRWEKGRFFISSFGVDLPKFPQGKLVRKTMLLPNNGEYITMTLSQVLEIVTDSDFEAFGKLKEYLDTENGSR